MKLTDDNVYLAMICEAANLYLVGFGVSTFFSFLACYELGKNSGKILQRMTTYTIPLGLTDEI